jgi:hypothetical protein
MLGPTTSLHPASFNILLLMFYFDLYIINVDAILPPDLGPFAVNKYIHTYMLWRVVLLFLLAKKISL